MGAAGSTHAPSDLRFQAYYGPVRPSTLHTLDTVLAGATVKTEEPNYEPSPESEPIPDSFNANEVFAEEAAAEMETEARPSIEHVQKLIQTGDLNLLEAGVERAVKVLDTLRTTFAKHENSEDAQEWIKTIDRLKVQAERKRTVVGVVGNTGAGKSSVINAILDEERLVPTNCMRACTAVVTEISWNKDHNPFAKYRAEIEFFSKDEWEKELTILLKEFLTEDGTISRETSDPNTDAGIAWAKFHAVYPMKAKETLAKTTIAQFLAEKSVANIVGTTKKIHRQEVGPFYNELQRYVDSKEKASGMKSKKDKEKKTVEMEYWPLIKVVKLYTKSEALSTGAVIVDLPGVHDANAARAAVAQGYMKQCTGLWIVAPINRAVDDKAAKSLLGDSFKRQLKYDGGFSSVTFICSKTDDISVTEAIDSLELDDENAELEEKRQEQLDEVERNARKINELQESASVYQQAIQDAQKDIDEWDKLLDEANEGKTVYAPVKKSTKRKHTSTPQKSEKRQRSDDDDDNFIVDDVHVSVVSDDSDEDGNSDYDYDADADSDADDEGVRAPQVPLTDTEIKKKLEELRDTKKAARRERSELLEQIMKLKDKNKVFKEEAAKYASQLTAICIAGRNEYSKGAIQRDFAAGIKELDQEAAAEDDEENFNPDKDIRDYDEVAKSLPVFCVSSRAYQKLSGRLKKDSSISGFMSMEETEMPQLQAHCKKLTETGRLQTCKMFLNAFCSQLTTFSFWASDDGAELKLTDAEKKDQVRILNHRLGELEKGLEKAAATCIKSMKKDMEDQIFEKYPSLIQEAMEAAPNTADKWGRRKDEDGLVWATYKATVRRNGIFTGTSGARDFNADLVDPITKNLATSWERTFQNRLPSAFEVYTKNSNAILRKFHDTVEERARQNGVGLTNISALKGQIYAYEELFEGLKNDLVQKMTEVQREANRDFTPTITAIMHTAYVLCTEESGEYLPYPKMDRILTHLGPGSFKRMKAHMAAHVDYARRHMFQDAAETVQNHLNEMCKELQELMEEKADQIFVNMRCDYLRVLGGVQLNEEPKMSKEDRAMRAEVRPMLFEVDVRFERILNGEIDEPEVVDVTAQDGDAAPAAQEENAQQVDDRMDVDVPHEDQQPGEDNAGSAVKLEPQSEIMLDEVQTSVDAAESSMQDGEPSQASEDEPSAQSSVVKRERTPFPSPGLEGGSDSDPEL